MDITAVDPHEVDLSTATALAEVTNAAAVVDSPQIEPVSGERERLRLRHGWDNRGTDHLLLAHDGDTLVGFAEINLPYWDNTHMGFVDLQTHPDHRGLGYGDAILEESLGVLRGANRTLLMSDAWSDSHRAKFWERHGMELGMVAVQRRLFTAELDWPKLGALLSQSETASADYEIIEVPLPVPESNLPQMIELQLAMNDAPLDDLDLEDDVWNDERFKGVETASIARGKRVHRLVARRRSDGVFGGFTVVDIESDRPWICHQEDTGVIRGHRGHRLGLRLKIEMLKRLRELEPQITYIDTWNAESNQHMIAVNELLGCVVVGRGLEYQKPLT
jgi:GNAT superfamily N-acetyltransferase